MNGGEKELRNISSDPNSIHTAGDLAKPTSEVQEQLYLQSAGAPYAGELAGHAVRGKSRPAMDKAVFCFFSLFCGAFQC